MKKVFLILIVFALMLPAVASADEQRDAAVFQAFQPILSKYINFFKANPKLLVKGAPPEKPKAVSFSIHQFQFRQAYYDIVKSNSIVTPYNAFIDISTDVADNKPCGTVSYNNKDKDGWGTIAETVRQENNPSCYALRTSKTGPLVHRFQFDYQVQSGKWVPSKIVYPDGKLNGRFMAVVGIASPWFPAMDEPEGQAYNRNWRALLLNQ